MDRKERGGRDKKRSGRGVNASSSHTPETLLSVTRAPRKYDRFRRCQSDAPPATTSGSSLETLRHSESEILEIKSSKRSARTKKLKYTDYAPLSTCLARYECCDSTLIRGKIRVIAGGQLAFVACDRGTMHIDVVIEGELNRNRAIDGDQVYVEILPTVSTSEITDGKDANRNTAIESLPDNPVEESTEALIDSMLRNTMIGSEISNINDELNEDNSDSDGKNLGDAFIDGNGVESLDEYSEEDIFTWQEDPIQMQLWNPTVSIRKNDKAPVPNSLNYQQKGRVIYVIPARYGISRQASELNPSDEKHLQESPRRTIVGSLKKLPSDSTPPRYLFYPNNRSLPCFMTPFHTHTDCAINSNLASVDHLFKAEYVHGTWSASDKWPPCVNLKPMGQSLNVEDETEALLVEFGVNHGNFNPKVLKSVDDVVRSGRQRIERRILPLGVIEDLGWSPTPSMYLGRRDYRNVRIFTIDPTTAKDLDDAVHIKPLPDGRVEIGVHIADVSYFVSTGSPVDDEAAKRATTVYLVDRTIPMLPRPLCEIACSLNENVERLAFSCVWIMNVDGTMGNSGENKAEYNQVWYGRTVIKSCARLDYATAQNIIDGKVVYGEDESNVDEHLWPQSRRPTGGHTMDEVATDVRLMHKVAMARRKLRYAHGAIALHGTKLTFQLDNDGQTPSLCEPYPIRDSNRLIEEYMLLANFLVAQKLITSAGGLALLRHHPPPIANGLQNVIDIAKESVGFHLDGTSSQALQESLSRMGRECTDQLALQSVTELLMTPMRPAEYIAAGEFEEIEWRHFALNIPYYTHFTSPIRRYADILVHRLLQATLDGEEGMKTLSLTQLQLQSHCEHCNDLRMAAKKAQERSDRIFLSLFLKDHPAHRVLAVVLSIGEKSFTVFVPSLALTTKVFIDDHVEEFECVSSTTKETNKRTISFQSKGVHPGHVSFDLHIFMKLAVSCRMKTKPPLDVQVMVDGPWSEFHEESEYT